MFKAGNTYNVTLNGEDLNNIRRLWNGNVKECTSITSCDNCPYFDADREKCSTNVLLEIIKKCIEFDIKFRKEDDE